MARNELTKDAMAIADLIYRKSSGVGEHKRLARMIGISESQFSRVFSRYVDMYAAVIDELDIVVIDKEELAALKLLARKALGE